MPVVYGDLKIGGFKMQTIKIMWNGKEEDIEIGKIMWGLKTHATRKSTTTKIIGMIPEIESDLFLLNEYLILFSIKKAPFVLPKYEEETMLPDENTLKKSLCELRKISQEDGDKLHEAYKKENEMSPVGE